MSQSAGCLRLKTRGWVSRAWRVLLLALAVFPPLAGEAAVLCGETSDTEVRSDGVVSAASGNTMLPGGSGSPFLDRAAVDVIQLPSLGVVANPFTTATLRSNLTSKSGPPPNLDLYALGRRASSTVLASDYYGHAATVDPSDVTLLQSNFLTSAEDPSNAVRDPSRLRQRLPWSRILPVRLWPFR